MRNSEKQRQDHKQAIHAQFIADLLTYCDNFKFNPLRESFKITLAYAVVGSLWILFSDVSLTRLVNNKETILLLSIAKGWFYVFLSALFIFLLILKVMKRNKLVESKLVESIKELSATYHEREDYYGELVVAEEELNRLINRLNRAQAMAKVGNWELDIADRTMWGSVEAFNIYGFEFNDSQSLSLERVQGAVHPEDRPGLNVALKDLINENKPYDMNFRVFPENGGEERHIHSMAVLEKNEAGFPEKVLGVIHDITENRIKESIIEHMAYYDVLTNLPNRIHFMDNLTAVTDRAKRMQSKVAIVFLDIDNFKKINDTLGHAVGDVLIQQVSDRIRQVIRTHETLARFGGDEFVIFIQDIVTKEEIASFVERVRSAFHECFELNGNLLYLSASIGIAVFPEDGQTPHELIKNADVAMYKAKEHGKNTFQFFNQGMIQDLANKFIMEKFLRNAMENEEFYLNYQPQIEASTGRIRGCEALLRWKCQELGRISPNEFIPVAEETGLIVEIGEWVLRTACRMNKEWHELTGYQWIVSVNISPIQLKQKGFIDSIKQVLQETGLQPELLELEVTENILIDSFGVAYYTLEEIKRLGIRIALDDFGTGYSSLSYLRKLKFNTLKIDKIIVQNIAIGAKEEAIFESIISLAHNLGMEVIAEGVETEEQLQSLKGSNCDDIQGFLLCKPVRELAPVHIAELKRRMGEREPGIFGQR